MPPHQYILAAKTALESSNDYETKNWLDGISWSRFFHNNTPKQEDEEGLRSEVNNLISLV